MTNLQKLAAKIDGLPMPSPAPAVAVPPDQEIPDFLRLTQAERRAAWARYDAARAVTQTATAKGDDVKPTTKDSKAAQVANLRKDRATKGPKKLGGGISEAAADTYARRAALVKDERVMPLLAELLPPVGKPVTKEVTETVKPSAASAKVTKPSTKPSTTPKPTADAAAKQQETKMIRNASRNVADKPTKAKASPKTSARAKPASGKKTATANARKAIEQAMPTGMGEKIGKLASRPNGASRAELIELSGWKAQAWKWYFINSKDNGFCQKFGYKLDVIEGKDGETRYKITKK